MSSGVIPMKPNFSLKIILISVAISLAIVGGSVIFTFVSLRTIEEPEVETVITISPTSPAEDYAANAAKRKRKSDWHTNRLGDSLRHSTDANKHNHPHQHGALNSTGDHAAAMPWHLPDDEELKKELDVMRAEYEAFLKSAHPDVAAAMKARMPLSALTVENVKKVVRDRQRQKP